MYRYVGLRILLSVIEVQIVSLVYIHRCISEVIHNPSNPRSSAHCSYDALLPSISLKLFMVYIFVYTHGDESSNCWHSPEREGSL